MNKIISARFEIYGFVQGVGYRYFAYRHAIEFGLYGFAKNNYDGSVTVEVEGDEIKVAELLKVLKTGPSRSHVDKVISDYSGIIGKFDKFVVI